MEHILNIYDHGEIMHMIFYCIVIAELLLFDCLNSIIFLSSAITRYVTNRLNFIKLRPFCGCAREYSVGCNHF